MVRLPRNQFAGSKKYEESAPLFATMADLFSYPMDEARRTGRSIERENLQFQSRWNIVRYRHVIPQEARDPTLEPCASCCARWYCAVLQQEAHHFATDACRVVRVMPAPVIGMSAPQDALAPVSGANAVQTNSRYNSCNSFDIFQKLTQLMQWHSEGRLSDAEFANAKRLVGL